MIVELFLISQLLAKKQLSFIQPVVDPHASFDPIISKPAKLGLFKLGKIETITQPLIIDPIKIDWKKLDWKPDYKKGKF